ncbi:hypothetical protein K435DRAFT_807864 [Dendrothele bispora CBS 962.96]|uniref:Uncharacterized protein n=1 Tax=Dendrothele bispora (strain CBS 962.96) TaxID=1314807 RepID=A0A4S8L4L1_DENBC|nr:hypothetical protein K435DRAFT_807864 [Dendrothele bispora CBS 962.96]
MIQTRSVREDVRNHQIYNGAQAKVRVTSKRINPNDLRIGAPSEVTHELHNPKSGLKGINKLDSFTVDVHKIVTAKPSESRELVELSRSMPFLCVIKLGDKISRWMERKEELRIRRRINIQWICEGNNFRLIDKSDPSSEIAVFKGRTHIPISERLETGQDKPEQRWVPPMLSINVGDTQSELFHLVLATFVYYAKIKIEAMGGFASIQSTGTYSAGISNVVSGAFAAS